LVTLYQDKVTKTKIGRRYASAIIGGKADTAQAKKEILRASGIHVVDSPAEIGKKMAEVLGK